MKNNMNRLFELLLKKIKKIKFYEKTQVWICKRCKGSVHDKIGAYCSRMDLCLDFAEKGEVTRTKNGQPIECNGKEWQYLKK